MIWLDIQGAAKYLGCSRQTVYRLMRRGELIPDGRVGARKRFSMEALDAYVQCEVSSGHSVGHLAGTEVPYADKKEPAKANGRTRDKKGWPRPVPGARRLDRRTDGPKEEEKEGLQDDARGGCVQGESRGVGGKIDYQTALRRIRRAMDEDEP